MKTVRVTIDQDPDVEAPCNEKGWEDGWVLHSFCRRHRNFTHPSDLGLGELDETGNPKVMGVGLRKKLEAGTAFILSYFEHGNCVWSLQGEGPQCRWDSVRVAGLLVWRGKPEDCGSVPNYKTDMTHKEYRKGFKTDYKAREASARGFLEYYTAWANGNCYSYRIDEVDKDGEEVFEGFYDGCGGYVGEKDVKQAVMDVIRTHKLKVSEVSSDYGFEVEDFEEAAR